MEVVEALLDFNRGGWKMVLCMAAYLVLISLTWTYLDGGGWASFQLRAHFSRMRDIVLAISGSGKRSPDCACLAGIFLALTLFRFGHIQLGDGFCPPRLDSEGKSLALHL